MTNMELEKTANEVRKSIVTAVHSAKAGHPGGSLSAADIFTYLYFEELNIDPKNPKMQTATVLCFQKATRRRDFMQFWQNVDFPEGGSCHTASYRLLPAGTSGYETHSGD